MQRKNFVVMAWTLLYKMITKAWHEWGKDFTIRRRYLQAATINKRRWKDAFLIFYVLSLTPSEFCFALVIFYHDLRTLSACRSPSDIGLFVTSFLTVIYRRISNYAKLFWIILVSFKEYLGPLHRISYS